MIHDELDFISGQINKVSQEILRFTPQLYQIDDAREPVQPLPYASVVLLQVQDSFFLLTAAHVFSTTKKLTAGKIGMMIEKDFFPLQGELTLFGGDAIDLAIICLTEALATELMKNYAFLSPNQLATNHTVVETPQYLLCGFPASKTKINTQKQSMVVNPLLLLTKQTENKFYQKLKLETYSHIILNYRKSKIKNFDTKMINQGPDPYGISGSGLWYLPSFIDQQAGKIPFLLAGIMIEWRNKENLVIASRIHLITEVLRQKYNLALEPSTLVNVKINTSTPDLLK